jgi:hypothetical protein
LGKVDTEACQRVTVMAVHDGNRMDGIAVGMPKTSEHYVQLQRESEQCI